MSGSQAIEKVGGCIHPYDAEMWGARLEQEYEHTPAVLKESINSLSETLRNEMWAAYQADNGVAG